MGLLDKAKEAAEQARQAATQAVDQARTPTQAPGSDGAEVTAAPTTDQALPPVETAVDPAAPVPHAPKPPSMEDFKAQMMKAARRSKDSIATLVEKIDPGVLADLIIKATAAQEKANMALRDRKSPYRIAEINITATIPPQVGFSVARMGDMDELDDPASLLIEEGLAESEIVSLDGENPIAGD